MSDSNRIKRPALVDWALPLIGIVLALSVAIGMGWLSGRESERRYQSPHHHSERAKANAQRACVGIEPGAVFECIYEKIEASEETGRAEQDLSAQQRAASAALASAVIALITLLVTAIGVWFVKRTLDATLDAVKDTSKATEAMLRQNELVEQGQRPWLTVEVVEVGPWEVTEGGSVTLQHVLRIKNCGQSPALFARYAIVQEVKVTSGQMVDAGRFLHEARPRNMPLNWFALGPGQEFTPISQGILEDLQWQQGAEQEFAVANLMIGVVYQAYKGGAEFHTIERIMVNKILYRGEVRTTGEHRFYKLATLMI